MEGSFSDSVYKRLPCAIQRLDLTHQDVFIYLRLRKKEEEISLLLGIPLENARAKVKKVKEELISAGQIDLIDEPKFVSIHSSGQDEHEFPLHAEEIPIDKRLIIKEFLSFLKEAIDSLPENQSRILRLRYGNGMTAREILEFANGLNIILIPGKAPSDVKEQDVFYALNSSLKAVLEGLKNCYGDGTSIGMDNLKCIFEEIEI